MRAKLMPPPGGYSPTRTGDRQVEGIWQKNYAAGVPSSIDFEEITLTQALTRTAGRFPDVRALMFQGTEITFRELKESVERFSEGLKSLGIGPGDRVSIILPNLVQTVVSVFGAMHAGAVVVMHNPRLDDMMLQHQLNDAGSSLVVGLDVLVPRIVNLRKKTKVEQVISCHIRDYLPFVKKKLFPFVKRELHLETPEGTDGVLEFKDFLEGHDPAKEAYHAGIEDLAFILYTSATTGKSKGVELTQSNLSKNVQQVRKWFPAFRDGKEVVVGCLPFFHSFGLTCALNISIFYGYGDVLVPLPEPKSILEAIDTYEATFIPAVPILYTGMINNPNLKKYNLKTLKGCFSGAAPLPRETIRAFEKLTGAQICEGYGLTECSPVSHINPLGGKAKGGTIGLPLPNTEAKIVDVDDQTTEITAPGEPGELCIRGPQVMCRYANLPQQTADTIKEGWLLTGDIVTMDEEGYFTVVDRKKDMIVTRGHKIYPRNVDEVLFSHPKVLDACAIGVPDTDSGESVKAYVVLKKGQKSGSLEIRDHCRKHLAPHEVPKRIEFLEDLPRSPTGKVLRKELRRMHLVRTS